MYLRFLGNILHFSPVYAYTHSLPQIKYVFADHLSELVLMETKRSLLPGLLVLYNYITNICRYHTIVFRVIDNDM